MLLMSSPRERNKGQSDWWVTCVCDSVSKRESRYPALYTRPYLLEPSIAC